MGPLNNPVVVFGCVRVAAWAGRSWDINLAPSVIVGRSGAVFFFCGFSSLFVFR